MPRESTVKLIFVFAVLVCSIGIGSCSSPLETAKGDDFYYEVDPEANLEFLKSSVVSVEASDRSQVYLAFEPWQRVFLIDRECSPKPVALAAFARKALASGSPVYATIQLRSRAPKGAEEGEMDVVLRLADTPDPRAPK